MSKEGKINVDSLRNSKFEIHYSTFPAGLSKKSSGLSSLTRGLFSEKQGCSPAPPPAKAAGERGGQSDGKKLLLQSTIPFSIRIFRFTFYIYSSLSYCSPSNPPPMNAKLSLSILTALLLGMLLISLIPARLPSLQRLGVRRWSKAELLIYS